MSGKRPAHAAGDLLDQYWAPTPAPFGRRGRVAAAIAAAGFVAAAIAALVVIHAPGRVSTGGVAALMLAYLLATLVRFELGPSFVLPTELTLVPLLFLAPLGAVPLLVAVAMVVGNAIWVVRGRLPADRLLSAVADSWHAVGPVAVLALAGAPEPSLDNWPLYGAAFGAQVVIEGLVLSVREWVDRGVPPLRHLVSLGEGHLVDVLLFLCGLLAASAATASGQVGWALLTVPFIALLALVDRDRRARIRISQGRLAALDRERSRGEAALVRVGQAMSARLDPSALLDLALLSALEAITADGASARTRTGELTRAGDPVGCLGERVGDDALRGIEAAAGVSDGCAALAVPIPGSGQPAVLICERHGKAFSPEERRRLVTLAAQLGAGLVTAAYHETVREQAETDHLTGLLNHRRFQELLGSAVERHAFDGAPPGLLLIDLDHFKRINDNHGHQTGDMVLQAIGRLLRERCRPGDDAARYGGEELAVVTTKASAADALALAERLRADIERLQFISPRGDLVEVTASIGVALSDKRLTTAAALVASADGALYEAKRAGRNCVVVAGDTTTARRSPSGRV